MADYKEFSRQIKAKYPEYKDVDDLKLAKAMIEKYPQYENQVTFDKKEPTRPKNKGIDLRPSGIANNISNRVWAAPLSVVEAIKEKKPLNQAYSDVLQNNENFINNNPELKNAMERGNMAMDLQAYTMLPEVNAIKGAGFGARVANTALTGAEQGAIIGSLEGLKKDGLKGLGGGALGGAFLGGALGGGLPLAGQATKLLPMAGGFVSRTIGRLQPETLQQAIKPNSQALDLSAKQAQNLLTRTTDRVRNAYNNLLKTKGEAIQAAEENLRNIPDRVNVKNVLGDIRRTFDKYSGDKVNVARNMTGNLENDLYDLIESAGKQVDNPPVANILNPDIQAEQKLLNEYNAFKNSLNKKYGSIDNLKEIANNDIKQNAMYGERFDSLDDYRNLLSYEQLLQNAKYIDNRIPSSVNGELLGNGNLGANPQPPAPKEPPLTISPIDLQKIKQQVGQMTNWADTTRPKIQNTVLEQVYGKMNKRLQDLSPELAQANKEFANIKSFQEDEGLKRILKPGDNVDSAASALKNYDATVTKGNQYRNIKELEDTLVKAGNEPFLNTIDDINAAMDLNNLRTTGDSWLANVGTALTKPGLRLARAYNRTPLPRIMYGIKNAGRRLAIPFIYNAPRLFGKVEETDY